MAVWTTPLRRVVHDPLGEHRGGVFRLRDLDELPLARALAVPERRHDGERALRAGQVVAGVDGRVR